MRTVLAWNARESLDTMMSPACIRILKPLPSLLTSKDFTQLIAAMIKQQNDYRCEADWSTFAKRAKLQ